MRDRASPAGVARLSMAGIEEMPTPVQPCHHAVRQAKALHMPAHWTDPGHQPLLLGSSRCREPADPTTAGESIRQTREPSESPDTFPDLIQRVPRGDAPAVTVDGGVHRARLLWEVPAKPQDLPVLGSARSAQREASRFDQKQGGLIFSLSVFKLTHNSYSISMPAGMGLT